jgi:hypothetical protein
MRPFVELNNFYFADDTLVYYSRTYILISFIIIFLCGIGSVYFLRIENGFIISILFWVFILHQSRIIFKLLKKINEVQFKINSKGIQFRNERLISWDDIENAKVISEGTSYKNRTYYFRYYIISENRVIKTDLEHLNMGSSDLELAIRVFTDKFNIEKNKI